jgi:hypothetical protein
VSGTDEIHWCCDGCGRPVTGDTGYLRVSYASIARHQDRLGAASADRSSWAPREIRVTPASEIPLLVRARWQVHHRSCDPDVDADDYWYAIGRVDTRTKLLQRSAHLFGKKWFADTDWPELVRRSEVRS